MQLARGFKHDIVVKLYISKGNLLKSIYIKLWKER